MKNDSSSCQLPTVVCRKSRQIMTTRIEEENVQFRKGWHTQWLIRATSRRELFKAKEEWKILKFIRKINDWEYIPILTEEEVNLTPTKLNLLLRIPRGPLRTWQRTRQGQSDREHPHVNVILITHHVSFPWNGKGVYKSTAPLFVSSRLWTTSKNKYPFVLQFILRQLRGNCDCCKVSAFCSSFHL